MTLVGWVPVYVVWLYLQVSRKRGYADMQTFRGEI